VRSLYRFFIKNVHAYLSCLPRRRIWKKKGAVVMDSETGHDVTRVLLTKDRLPHLPSSLQSTVIVGPVFHQCILSA
jgi:hypothetical protein